MAPQGPPIKITDEARDLIEEHNRLDNALYAYASERFEEAMRSYPSFVDDFARFKRTNAAYRPWGTLTHTYPQTVTPRPSACERVNSPNRHPRSLRPQNRGADPGPAMAATAWMEWTSPR